MKITMIGPVTPYRGGIAKFTTLLAKKMMEYGHEVQVISFQKQYPAWLYPGESDKDQSPGRIKVEAQFLLKPLDMISWRRTLQAIRDFNPQHVLFPWWVTFWGPAFYYLIKHIKRQGILVSILIHNTIPHETRPWDRFLAIRTLKDADRFIVMTEKEKKRLVTLLPQAKEIYLTPHPIYPPSSEQLISRDAARERLGLPLNAPILLFFGIIRPYKGLNVLLEAFKIVLTHEPSSHLLVAGEFWEDKTKYLAQIQTLGITGHVHLTDRYIPEDEVAIYFRAADLFVAPYIGGTQSGALKTALGYGLPVVLTDVISDKIMESLTDRCLVLPSKEIISLAEGILSRLKEPIETENIKSFSDSWYEIVSILHKSSQNDLVYNSDTKVKCNKYGN